MGIFDTFKRAPQAKSSAVKKAVGAERRRSAPSIEPATTLSGPSVSSGKSATAATPSGDKGVFGVLQEPHVTEKSTTLGGQGVYAFRVHAAATKTLVRRAIEGRFGVSVTSVRMVTVPSKTRRRGLRIGERSGYKKALVTVRKGDKIEVLPH